MTTRHPPELRAQIAADYQAGASTVTLSRQHDVSSSTILRWLDAAGIERRPAGPPTPTTCTETGCNQPHASRGYCRLHYGRNIRGYQPRETWRPFNPDDRLEDCRFMADHGVGLTEAARRVGISSEGLEAWLTKHDRDTLRVLRARDAWPSESRATFHGVAS